jgi:hypothetical protein
MTTTSNTTRPTTPAHQHHRPPSLHDIPGNAAAGVGFPS